MNDTAQAVADDNDPAVTQTGEQVGAQDELDTLLAQYQEGHEEPKKDLPPKSEQSDPVYQWAEQQMRERDKEATNQAITEAVKTVKTESGISLPDKMVRGYLELMAVEDPRISQAFAQRSQNPDQWGRVLKAAAKKLTIEMGETPDSKLTSDRNTVESAVRSASTAKSTQSESVDFSSMDRNQLDKYLRENV